MIVIIKICMVLCFILLDVLDLHCTSNDALYSCVSRRLVLVAMGFWRVALLHYGIQRHSIRECCE